MQGLLTFLRSSLMDGLLPIAAELEAAEAFSLSLRQVEETALEAMLLPARYARNRQGISVADQLVLLRSKVAVVGCGGLGGYVVEELARLGVGCLVIFDPDAFEENNLNRQLLSSTEALGKPKVDQAVARVRSINPAVTVTAYHMTFTAADRCLLGGAQVVVDALDSFAARRELCRVSREMGIMLVHGSVAGWYGQVATQRPDDSSVERLFDHSLQGRGVEAEIGTPAFTPPVIASLQAAEVCKIILGRGRLLIGRMLFIDMLQMSIQELPIHPDRS